VSAALRPDADRAAWLDARRQVITATDISAILGMNPYKSPAEVWQDKKGLRPDRDPSPAMEWGNRLEAVIAQKWADENPGIPLIAGEFIREDSQPLGCTPDFLAGADTLIEVKTAGEIVGRREFGAPGSDHVPRQYWLQCQFQLARTRRSVCILAVLIGGRDYREYRIPADPAIQAEMDRRALEWWATYVESDCPPPFDGSDSSDSVLRSMFPQDSGEEAQATPEMEDAIEDGQKLYQQFCAAETAWKAWRQNFQAQMGEASRLTSAFGRFSWKAQTRRTTDWRKLAQALGASKEQIAAHTKESTARPFLHPFEESK